MPSRLSAKGPKRREQRVGNVVCCRCLCQPLVLLNLVKKLKRPGSGVIIWDPAEARKLCKQQRRKSVDAACRRLLCVIVLNGESSGWEKLVPASGHIETLSQRAALAGLSRRCTWWSNQPLQARPAVELSDIIRSRQIDYTGDAVLKALPLRLEELAPGAS